MGVFLTYETILTGVVGVLYATKSDPPITLLSILIALGMLITLIWLYAQHNVKQVYTILDRRTYDNLPEHQETIKRIYRARKWESRLGIRAPVLLLLTYPIPILVLLIWISLFLYSHHWLL
jgi:hypothetical protein